MPGSSREERFRVEGDTLTVHGELGRHEIDGFSKALDELMGSGAPSPRVDLTRVEVMTSSCVRPLAHVARKAGEQDRRLTIRAKAGLSLMLDVSGVATLADVQTVS